MKLLSKILTLKPSEQMPRQACGSLLFLADPYGIFCWLQGNCVRTCVRECVRVL